MAKWRSPKIRYDKNGEMIRPTKGPRPKLRKSRMKPVDKTIASSSTAAVELYEPRVRCRIATESLSYRVMDMTREIGTFNYCNSSTISRCKHAQKKLTRMRQFLKGIRPHLRVEQGAPSSAPGDQP